MSKKKSKNTLKEPKVEAVQEEQPQEQPQEVDQPQEVVSSSAPGEPELEQQEEPLTLESIYQELTNLKQLVAEHAEALDTLQSKPTRQRRPTPSGKILI